MLCPLVNSRVGKNLRNAGLNLTSKFGVFWGFVLKYLRFWTSKNIKPQNLNLRNTDLILTSKFEEFWGFFMIDLNCFTLPSTSKKPQYIFLRFFQDPQNTSISIFLSPISRPCQILMVYFRQKPGVQNSTQGHWKRVCSCTPSFLAISVRSDCFGHVMS